MSGRIALALVCDPHRVYRLRLPHFGFWFRPSLLKQLKDPLSKQKPADPSCPNVLRTPYKKKQNFVLMPNDLPRS